MRYYKIIAYAFLTLMASCSAIPDLNEYQSNLNTFYVDESVLDKGMLRINLPEEKPKCLSIQSPNGEWFVLQDSDEFIEIMSQKSFDSVKKMEFKITELKGVTWRESKKFTELVFKSSGKYLIYFADNLETEPENTYSLQETIYFKGYE